MLQGSGAPNQYSYAFYDAPWTDYTVQGSIQIPAGSFGGGIGGRVDPATGAHYGAWVYPTGSVGGSNMLKLWKFRGWTDIGNGTPMQQVNLPDVGTGWHTLQMNFIGDRIRVYYDGVLQIDETDNNFDSRPPYLSGGISADWWIDSLPYTIAVDNISVTTLPAYGSSGVLSSSAFDGGDGVQWQTVSWDAAAGGSTNVCVRTRTADAADQLASAPWSDCYSTSGSGITSANSRWIQYQLELTTSDPSVSPVLNEIRIGYLAPATTTIPDTTTILPTTSTSTSSIIPTTSIPTTTTTVPATTILPTTTTTLGQTWTQTDWTGGGGLSIWGADATRYDSASGIDTSINGQISLASTSSELFTDYFNRPDLFPWLIYSGTWTITNEVLQGSGAPNQYSYAFYDAPWTDYTVQGSIQIPAGSFGGGIGGRVDPATGAHYGAWVYPGVTTGVLKLWNFPDWTAIGPSSVPIQQVDLPDAGTGSHTLKLTFKGNHIQVFYNRDPADYRNRY